MQSAECRVERFFSLSKLKVMADSILRDKSFAFAVNIVKTCQELAAKKEFVLSRQLMRSGTAIGALTREAKNAGSKKDFANKLTIALKEADETIYWLDLLFETNYIQKSDHHKLHSDCVELVKMLTASLKTVKLVV
jgi:four helix bundle protein